MKKRLLMMCLSMLMLSNVCVFAESKFLYYVGNDEIKRYLVNIGEFQYWAGEGSSLHMETGLVLGNAILCEPELGNYNGVIIIPETIDFDGADYKWEGYGTWHFEPKELKVTGCVAGVFENCRALKKVVFPNSYEQVFDKYGFPTKFNSLGVSFKGCISLLVVENMNLLKVFANQFEGCSSLKNMDLSQTLNIEGYAFSGCSSLENITFKSNVGIGDYAFTDCNAINKIIVQSESSPNPFNDNVFTQTVYEKATLIVPKGKVNKFKQTKGWKNFFKIYEEGSEPSTDPTTEPTDSVTLVANSYSRQYGEDNPTFDYTVYSGKVESGTPTITCAATKTSAVGTYDIIIEKGSVSNKHVTLVNGELTITKAPLTISVGDYSKVEGESNPSFTLSYSGFKNGEDSSVLTKQPTVSCSATASSSPGTYPIIVSGADAKNYDISYKNGTLTITAKQNSPVGDAEPYVVYNDSTLTFYCDSLRSSRKGTTYDLNQRGTPPEWREHKDSIAKVVFDASFANARPITTSYWFWELSSMTEIEGMSYLNTSEVTDMNSMFDGCSSLTTLDLSHFDTKNVTTMGQMFYGCNHLTSLDLSKFDTGNVTYMGFMFYLCHNLTSLDVSHFDTKKVTGMRMMFSTCQKLTTLDVSSFDVQNATDLSEMFAYCSGLTTLDVSKFNTENAVTMGYMFKYCDNLTSLGLSSFNTQNAKDCVYESWTNYGIEGMLSGCHSLTQISFGSGFVSDDKLSCNSVFDGDNSLKEVAYKGDIPASINSEFFNGVGTVDSFATLNVPEQYKANYQEKFDGNKFFGGYFQLSSENTLINAPLEMTCKVINAVDGIVYDNRPSIKMTWKNIGEKDYRGNVWHNIHKQLENGEWFNNWRGSGSPISTLKPGESTWMNNSYYNIEDGIYIVEWGYEEENGNNVSIDSTIIEVRGHDRYRAIWMDYDIDQGTWKTFCDEDNLDFSHTKGLTAYIATTFNSATCEVQMQQVSDAVAGTGLLLVGETGCYLAERTVSATTYSSNMLVGVLGETTYIKSNEDGYANFRYNGKSKNNEQKFIIASDKGSPVRSNEAYLRIPSEAAGDADYITPVIIEFGDANGDGTVNAADIVEVVNYIMNKPSAIFDASAADVNGDGVVNAADIVEMVNIIMKQ